MGRGEGQQGAGLGNGGGAWPGGAGPCCLFGGPAFPPACPQGLLDLRLGEAATAGKRVPGAQGVCVCEYLQG